jgi:hypothetical protein
LALENGIAGNFTQHSFRRGAATWAKLQILGSNHIQKLGWWKLSVYRLYIDTTEKDKLALAHQFISTIGIPGLFDESGRMTQLKVPAYFSDVVSLYFLLSPSHSFAPCTLPTQAVWVDALSAYLPSG